MRWVKFWLVCWLLAIMVGWGFAWGAERHKTLQLVVQIRPRASLRLDRNQVNFVGGKGQSVIPASEGPLTVTAKGGAGPKRPLTLTVRAQSDAVSPAGGIPLQLVQWTWTSHGRDLKNGALDRVNGQSLVTWSTGGVHQAQLQFLLKNDVKLPPQIDGTTITLSLSSP